MTVLLKKIKLFWGIVLSVCDWLLRFTTKTEKAAFSEISITN